MPSIYRLMCHVRAASILMPQALYINMMAAVPFAELPAVTGAELGTNLWHFHTGPDDLLHTGRGIAKTYLAPSPVVEGLAKELGLQLMPAFSSEAEVAAFGVLVCAPNIFAHLASSGVAVDETVRSKFVSFVCEVGADGAMADWAFAWGQRELAHLAWDRVPEAMRGRYADERAYVASVATAGGITEAAFASLEAGDSVGTALLRAHGRYLELLSR